MDTLLLTSFAVFFSFILCVAPFPNMIRRAKDKEMHYIPIYFLWINHSCRIVWLYYGILKNIVPFITNCVMTGIASILMLILYYFFIREKLKFVIFYTIFLIVTFVFSVYIFPVTWVGNIATTLGTLTYIVTAKNLKVAINTLNPKMIDLPITIVSFLNSFAWAFYGLIIFDYPLMIGCAIGVVVSIVLLVSYVWINCKKFKKKLITV
ncbi:unnamed protein product [Blepharisma stoltei]|uniref:Uncharacterized protein n=1 Tax=Blepharisma stoltei TaxID=1481888 RepID=A0AAU9J1C1_9CILI|nr:unnamed protein product [Blepharisma stoltei]